NNDGGDVIIDANTLTITEAGGVYTFTDGNGLLEEIDTNAEAIAYSNATSGLAATEVQAAIDELAGGQGTIDLVDNGDGKVTLVKPDGTTATVDKSDVTPNGDGTYTFTNNDGGDVIIDANTLTITEAGGVYTFTDGNGLLEEIDTNAEAIAYSNATSGLAATEVQAAIDELAENISSSEASNGLHIETVDPATEGHVKLGGRLTEETTIETDIDN